MLEKVCRKLCKCNLDEQCKPCYIVSHTPLDKDRKFTHSDNCERCEVC